MFWVSHQESQLSHNKGVQLEKGTQGTSVPGIPEETECGQKGGEERTQQSPLGGDKTHQCTDPRSSRHHNRGEYGDTRAHESHDGRPREEAV